MIDSTRILPAPIHWHCSEIAHRAGRPLNTSRRSATTITKVVLQVPPPALNAKNALTRVGSSINLNGLQRGHSVSPAAPAPPHSPRQQSLRRTILIRRAQHAVQAANSPASTFNPGSSASSSVDLRWSVGRAPSSCSCRSISSQQHANSKGEKTEHDRGGSDTEAEERDLRLEVVSVERVRRFGRRGPPTCYAGGRGRAACRRSSRLVISDPQRKAFGTLKTLGLQTTMYGILSGEHTSLIKADCAHVTGRAGVGGDVCADAADDANVDVANEHCPADESSSLEFVTCKPIIEDALPTNNETDRSLLTMRPSYQHLVCEGTPSFLIPVFLSSFLVDGVIAAVYDFFFLAAGSRRRWYVNDTPD
ncbi:hypothetical protein C8R43DRAFT_1134622 [Mycena crocata]|nr:hypothetical protein C8R43DRAFT_1134622 [Mycena crocata]